MPHFPTRMTGQHARAGPVEDDGEPDEQQVAGEDDDEQPPRDEAAGRETDQRREDVETVGGRIELTPELRHLVVEPSRDPPVEEVGHAGERERREGPEGFLPLPGGDEEDRDEEDPEDASARWGR